MGARGLTVAFEIRPGERLRHALKRASRAQLESARRTARNHDESPTERAHELRTALKKVRALVRLLRPTVGGPARAADMRLGKCAREVARLRDAEVILQTFDDLCGDLPAPRRHAMRRARGRLAERLEEEKQFIESARLFTAIAERLEQEENRLGRWMPGGDAWKTLGPGIEAGYRKARQTMKRAYRRPGTTAFHAWRRAVKTHRFQLRFLVPLEPEAFGARIEELDLLGDLLGQEHDLAVLLGTLAAQCDCFDDQRDHALFLELLRNHRRDKRDRARPIGERLFADRPSVMRRRVHRRYRAFRRDPAAEPD